MLYRNRLLVMGIAVSFLNTAILLTTPGMAVAQVEEIVVTARKKEESLQEVPLSIAAFSGEQMQKRGIQSNYDVANFTPNFSTAQRVGRTLDRPTIRGMSNPGSRGEANASYFIDGMFVSGSIATATTSSMERVEVLRGPQSAQFGRATFSGAVNYITRKPTNDWEAEINTRAGTSEDYQASGWVSGPIIQDTLGLLVSASWEHYGGQWRNELQPVGDEVNENGIPVPAPGSAYVPGDPMVSFTRVFDGQNTEGDTSSLGGEKTFDFLTKLQFTPGETTNINLKYSFTRGDDEHYPSLIFDTLNCFLPEDGNENEPWFDTSPGAYCGEFDIEGRVNRKNLPDIRNGMMPNSQIIGGLPDEAVIAAPAEPGLQRDIHRVLGEWEQEIGEWTSTLKTGYTREDFDAVYDLDLTEARAVWGLFAFNTQEDRDDWSVEYSIASPVDRPIRGKLGVYYYNYKAEFIQRSVTGPFAVFSVPPGALYGDPRHTETENKSVFGGISFDLADNWTLDIEARYAEDNKDITSGQLSEELIDADAGNYDPDFSVYSTPVSDSLSFTNFTPRFTLSWQYNDDINLYGLIAKGNKPGGFNREYFRSDVPSEYTLWLMTCEDGDPPPSSLPQLNPCNELEKSFLTYEEEEQWTYEAGIKSQWFDRRITANVSIFFIDWINQGLFTVIDVPQIGTGGFTTTTILTNAGATEVYGLELESNFMISDNLFAFLNYGYNYGEFQEGFDPALENVTGDGNLRGNETPGSPNHSVVFGFEATTQVMADTDAFLRGDFLYESKKWNGASNHGYIGDRKNVNLRTGLQSINWTLSFYVRNLLDDDTPVAVTDFVNFGVNNGAGWPNNGVSPQLFGLNPSRERDAGVEFQYRFGR